MNWEGIATFLVAIGGFLTVCVNLAITIINFRDNRKGKIAAERREAKLDSVKTHIEKVANAIPDKSS